MFHKTLSFFIILSSFFFIHYATAYAVGGISVTPQIQTIDLSKDASTVTFKYKNTTPSAIVLNFSMKDFAELEESGLPGFLDDKSAQNYKYGLASWASLSTQTVLLNPGDEKSIDVSIDKTRLTLGGHYASVLAEIAQPENDKNVRLRGVLAALLFVRSGSEFDREEEAVESLVPDSDFYSFPQTFILRLINRGNVDVTPHGTLDIYDPLGKKVGNAIINEASNISLPETIRRYNISVLNTPKLILPGVYRVDVYLHFGHANKTLFYENTFFSLGSFDVKVLTIIGVLIIVLIAIKRMRNTDELVEDEGTSKERDNTRQGRRIRTSRRKSE